MGKRFAFVVLGLALLASACGGVKGAQKYTIQADQQEPSGKKIQYSQWFPANLTAQAGDTLVFTNKSSEAPHTFTFGVKADRSDAPPLFGPKGLNPAAFGPCSDPSGSSTKMMTCANPKLGSFDGKGYFNTGVVGNGAPGN